MKINMFVVLASLFMACGTPKDGYVVKGSLKNAGDGYAVISVADHTGASVIADTAEMSGGKFRFEGKTPFVAACSLRVVPEGKEVLDMLIVLENSPIKLQGDWANLERNTGGLFSGVGIRKTTGNHGGTSVIGSGSAVLDPHDRRDEVGRVRAGIRAV